MMTAEELYSVQRQAFAGMLRTLWEVSAELSHRLMRIFIRDSSGKRPVYGNADKFQADPHWRKWVLFHEFFHGDTGLGLGASHQTGWTGLVAKLIQQCGEYCLKKILNMLNKLYFMGGIS